LVLRWGDFTIAIERLVNVHGGSSCTSENSVNLMRSFLPTIPGFSIKLMINLQH
jgi:hypothetical protein